MNVKIMIKMDLVQTNLVVVDRLQDFVLPYGC